MKSALHPALVVGYVSSRVVQLKQKAEADKTASGSVEETLCSTFTDGSA
jgi:hypothetical protein